MVRYEVTAVVEPGLVERYETYMRRHHIPEILATECFVRVRLERASPTRYRLTCEAATRADLDRYLAEHTTQLRAAFLGHLPAGVVLNREVWEEVPAER